MELMIVLRMMGIANNGRWGQWVPRRMASRAMGPQMTSAVDDIATYTVDWRSRYIPSRDNSLETSRLI